MKDRVMVSPQFERNQSLSNARLGIILFIAAEMMLFAGLIAGYVVLRFGSGNFEGMDRLPVGLTGISTALLIASSISIVIAGQGLKHGAVGRFKQASLAALLLGIGFLLLQVIEWNQLIESGASPDVNVYGGMFYALSWVHGAHVLGGIVLLAVLAIRAFGNKFSPARRNFVVVASIYWHFVTLVWLGLFVILFLV